jgi:hypothetical protein
MQEEATRQLGSSNPGPRSSHLGFNRSSRQGSRAASRSPKLEGRSSHNGRGSASRMQHQQQQEQQWLVRKEAMQQVSWSQGSRQQMEPLCLKARSWWLATHLQGMWCGTRPSPSSPAAYRVPKTCQGPCKLLSRWRQSCMQGAWVLESGKAATQLTTVGAHWNIWWQCGIVASLEACVHKHVLPIITICVSVMPNS